MKPCAPSQSDDKVLKIHKASVLLRVKGVACENNIYMNGCCASIEFYGARE